MDIALHPDAAALTAVREVGGDLRTYTVAEPTGGRAQIDRILRQARAVGFIRPAAGADSYAVLDVLDENDDIVQDYAIPTATAWRWWYRKLHLRTALSE